MKFFTAVLTITFALLFLFSFQTYGKMNSLSNESLSNVEGDPGIKHKQVASTPIEESDSAAGTEIIQENNLKAKLCSLVQSDEYKKFLFYLKRLDDLSAKGDYKQLAASDKFTFFSSCLAATASNCSKKLCITGSTPDDSEIEPVVSAKNRIFEKAVSFNNNLLDYRNGKTDDVKLKELIDDIKKSQNAFETQYAEFKKKR